MPRLLFHAVSRKKTVGKYSYLKKDNAKTIPYRAARPMAGKATEIRHTDRKRPVQTKCV
jgi:hypothetical protein